MADIDGGRATRAVLVGIEEYAAGPRWDLNGPARDACGMAHWLLRRGLKACQISLFLSPLSASTDLPVPTDLTPRRAEERELRAALAEGIRDERPQVVLLFWGGHGVITADGRRLLFYADADADNKRHLDLSALLTFWRTDFFPPDVLAEQIVIVDACANFVENRNWRTGLPAHGFPNGQGVVEGREQFLLVGARPGEAAENLDAERTGLFSRALFQRLEDQPWPPPMQNLSEDLVRHFVDLRNRGEADQTPSYLSFGAWGAQERTVGQVRAAQPRPDRRLRLTFAQKAQLADALYDCSCLFAPEDRAGVLRQMRLSITGAVRRSPAGKIDVFNIVDTCSRYSDGLTELIRVTRTFEGESDAMTVVDQVLREIAPGLFLEPH